VKTDVRDDSKIKNLLKHFEEQLERARKFEADENFNSQYWQGNADALEGVIADVEEMIKEQNSQTVPQKTRHSDTKGG